MLKSDENAHSVANQEDEVFYPSAFPIFLMIASLAGIGCFGFILLTEGSDIHVIGVAIAGVVLIYGAFRWARVLAVLYPVYVSPEGLQVYGLRAGPLTDNYWLEWSNITRVSRFYVPFNPCLVLRTRTSKRRYWIPLSLVNAARFRDLVNNYAGRAHPLTRALYE